MEMFKLFKKKIAIDADCLAQAVSNTTDKLHKQFIIAESLYELSNAEVSEIIKTRVEAQMMFLSYLSKIFDFSLQDAYHNKNKTRLTEDLPQVDFNSLPSLRMVWLKIIDDPVASANLRLRFQYIFDRGLMNPDEQELWDLMENISSQSKLHFMYGQKLSLTWLDFIVSLSKLTAEESMNILRSNQSSYL